jgi:hypothetical protein
LTEENNRDVSALEAFDSPDPFYLCLILGGLDEGLVSRDRKAIREKIETAFG